MCADTIASQRWDMYFGGRGAHCIYDTTKVRFYSLLWHHWLCCRKASSP